MSATPTIVLATQKLTGLSGKVSLILENARGLGERGWRVDVVAQALDTRLFDAAGVHTRRVIRPPIGRAGRLHWFSRQAARHARRSGALLVGHGESLLEQDVLHVHNCVHRTYEETHGRPLTGAAEVGAARAQRRILAARRYQHIVANSALTRDELVERFGIDPELITVVHPGHDPERFCTPLFSRAAEILRKRLGVPEGGVLVGVVTSGDFTKRAVGPFLAALGGLPGEQKSNLHVVVVGKERNVERYTSVAAESGLRGRVHFLPPRADVETVYHALDMYVHPAHFEEFGMSVLEAMACGVPVLTSRKVGASELLHGTVREELLDDSSIAGLRDGVARLLADPDRRRALAEAGRLAARECTWKHNVRAHSRCYERILAERSATSPSPA